jgi:hypothetical protein
MQSANQSQQHRTISGISFRGPSELAQKELLARMPIHEGTALSDELLQEARREVKRFDERLETQVNEAPVHSNVPPKYRDTVSVIIYDPATVPRRILLDESVLDSVAIEKALPVSPAAGMVRLSVVVAKDGTVAEIDPLAGPELLVEPAMDAVKRWRYRPVLLNGLPVEVQTTLHVSFAPGQ